MCKKGVGTRSRTTAIRLNSLPTPRVIIHSAIGCHLSLALMMSHPVVPVIIHATMVGYVYAVAWQYGNGKGHAVWQPVHTPCLDCRSCHPCFAKTKICSTQILFIFELAALVLQIPREGGCDISFCRCSNSVRVLHCPPYDQYHSMLYGPFLYKNGVHGFHKHAHESARENHNLLPVPWRAKTILRTVAQSPGPSQQLHPQS